MIGLLDSLDAPDGQKGFTLKESLFPALREALEEAFGKDSVEETLERANFYKAAGPGPVAGTEDASDANGKRRSKARKARLRKSGRTRRRTAGATTCSR